MFDRPLSGFQLTQEKLADMTRRARQGHAAGDAPRPASRTPRACGPSRSASASSTTSARPSTIARECRTLLGGSGITLEYSPLRHANNLESVLTYEGTSEMHLLVIGQALTGQAAFR